MSVISERLNFLLFMGTLKFLQAAKIEEESDEHTTNDPRDFLITLLKLQLTIPLIKANHWYVPTIEFDLLHDVLLKALSIYRNHENILGPIPLADQSANKIIVELINICLARISDATQRTLFLNKVDELKPSISFSEISEPPENKILSKEALYKILVYLSGLNPLNIFEQETERASYPLVSASAQSQPSYANSLEEFLTTRDISQLFHHLILLGLHDKIKNSFQEIKDNFSIGGEFDKLSLGDIISSLLHYVENKKNFLYCFFKACDVYYKQIETDPGKKKLFYYLYALTVQAIIVSMFSENELFHNIIPLPLDSDLYFHELDIFTISELDLFLNITPSLLDSDLYYSNLDTLIDVVFNNHLNKLNNTEFNLLQEQKDEIDISPISPENVAKYAAKKLNPNSEFQKRPFPLLLQFMLEDESQEIIDAFLNFYDLMVKINQEANPNVQIDMNNFLITYQSMLINQIKTFGKSGIMVLQKNLFNGLERLRLFLIEAPYFHPYVARKIRAFCQKYQNNRDEKTALSQCITTLNTVHVAIINGDYLSEKLTRSFIQRIENLLIEKPPSQLQIELRDILLNSVFDEFDFRELSIDIESLFSHLSLEMFNKLIIASSSMKNNEYKKIFYEFVKIDLMEKGFDNFLHDVNQENELGQQLATHNKNIETQLLNSGINPNMALHYNKTHDFMYIPGEQKDLTSTNALTVLWSYAKALKTAIDELKSKNELIDIKTQLQKILSNIEQIQRSINASHSVVLNKQIQLNRFSVINRNLKAITVKLDRLDKTNLLSTSFMEFSSHFSTQYNLALSSITNKHSEKFHHFTVKQWSKEQVDTFFLGNHIGCCLATYNNRFSAMVQRRMDDAMLFHVVIDRKNNKPVALTWLYLATLNNGKIALVANFFEVHTHYAKHDELRLALVEGLLTFTHQYCLDNPNIEGFYMHHLQYGWNHRDLAAYPEYPLQIKDKVGGAFVPDDDTEHSKEHTIYHYYLASLADHSKFHRFDKTILQQTLVAGVTPLSQIIKQGIDGLTSQERTNLQSTCDALIKHHSVELIPFFVDSSTGIFDTHQLEMTLINLDLAQKQTPLPMQPSSSSSPLVGNQNRFIRQPLENPKATNLLDVKEKNTLCP